ncbi:hypothetical protein [Halocatena halophila]|uniref:hypothetical protein n=1 Tax=Halocatena halophila TaxID=2814576 RepID=UPI002ED564D8
MDIIDILLLRQLMGKNQNRERIKTHEGDYVCGGCRSVIDESAHVCSDCTSKLYTIRGRAGRRLGFVIGLFLLVFSGFSSGIGEPILLISGLLLIFLSIYWYLTRPVHQLTSFAPITEKL